MNLTFNDLLVISQLIEDKADQATEDQREIYVKVRQEIRRKSSMNCELCGKGSVYWLTRPYKYDSGESAWFRICRECEKVHQQLTKGKE